MKSAQILDRKRNYRSIDQIEATSDAQVMHDHGVIKRVEARIVNVPVCIEIIPTQFNGVKVAEVLPGFLRV
jgi:hypothetical protein